MSSFGKKISCTGQLSLFITLVNLFSFRTLLLMLNSCQNGDVHCQIFYSPTAPGPGNIMILNQQENKMFILNYHVRQMYIYVHM